MGCCCNLPAWLARRLDPLELFLRLVLGGFFVFAAVPKLLDPLAFSESVRAYRILDDPWNAWVAMGLPVFELVAGAAVIFRVLYPGAVIALAGMLCAFIPALASLLWRGIAEECGCLGKGFPPDVQILIDVVLLGIAAALLWMGRRRAPAAGGAAGAD